MSSAVIASAASKCGLSVEDGSKVSITGLVLELKAKLAEAENEGRGQSSDGAGARSTETVDISVSLHPKDVYKKEIQRLYYAMVAETLADKGGAFYVSHYYDFRGRVYPASSASFMYLKAIRPFFRSRDCDSPAADLFGSRYFKFVLNSRALLPRELAEKTAADVDAYYALVLLSELGKLRKSKIMDQNGSVTFDSLVNEGIRLLGSESVWDEADELSYSLSIRRSINRFLSVGSWDNVTVIRDSTASSFQHWATELKVKSGFMKYLNLDGTVWYDTYTFIIQRFLASDSGSKIDERALMAFNRKNMKKIIMTANYNAGADRCFNVLKSSLKAESGYAGYDTELFRGPLYAFHSYLSGELFSDLYELGKSDYLTKNHKNLRLDDAILNLDYFTAKEKREVFKIGDKRWVLSRSELLTDLQDWRSNVALNANIIQALDARLARFLVNELNVWPVHDSFGIGLFEVHRLVDKTNLYFSSKLGSESWSPFVLI